jgi:hypothetical protein
MGALRGMAPVWLTSAMVLAAGGSPAAAGGEDSRTAEQVYALNAGEALRRVALPLPSAHYEILRRLMPGREPEHIEAGVIVRWVNGKPAVWGRKSSSAPWYTVADLVRSFLDVPMWELEGDEKLRNLEIAGDFVVDRSAAKERFRAAIERVAGEALGWRVTLAFREVERPVVVLGRRWRYVPVPDRKGEEGPPVLELYGAVSVAPVQPDDATEGTPGELANVISNHVGRRVVIEGSGIPPRLRVRRNEVGPGRLDGTATDDAAMVLRHLEEQTGLQAVEQIRKVRRLVIAPGE